MKKEIFSERRCLVHNMDKVATLRETIEKNQSYIFSKNRKSIIKNEDYMFDEDYAI